MDKKIICSICARSRDISFYSTGKQRHIKACNDCYQNKDHYARGLCSEVDKPRYRYKKVKCLKCGKSFLGGTSLRICKGCKATNAYQEALLSSGWGSF